MSERYQMRVSEIGGLRSVYDTMTGETISLHPTWSQAPTAAGVLNREATPDTHVIERPAPLPSEPPQCCDCAEKREAYRHALAQIWRHSPDDYAQGKARDALFPTTEPKGK